MSVNIPKTLSDHPSLVGIIRFPSCIVETQEVPIPIITKDNNNNFFNLIQIVDMAETISGSEKTSQAFNIPKSEVTDLYPYTYYVLTDSETDPLIMQPQYLPSTLTIKGRFALSNQPIERYYPSSYKNDTSGNIYNITNTNQMMLPTATNEGINYMNANSNTMIQARKNQVTNTVLSGVIGVGTGMVGGPSPMSLVSSGANIVSGINAIKETDARNRDLALTPNSISSFGTPSTRATFNTDDVKLIRYTINDKYKNKIKSYVERYGNKYNNYDTINLRNYKGYIKFISPNLDGGIDNKHIQKIVSILERGVYCE